MTMGADYSFELISIETYAPQFIGHNEIFLGSVYSISGQRNPSMAITTFFWASSAQVLSQRKPTTVTKKLAQSFVKARLCPPFAFDKPL